jgi:hypothetical protein
MESKGTTLLPFTVRAYHEDGSWEDKIISAPEKQMRLEFPAKPRITKIVIDPETLLPDINRTNNVKSLAGSRRIAQLFSIDERFKIGDLELISRAFSARKKRYADAQITFTNLQDKPANLGLFFSSQFPGGRSRGLTNIFIELLPGETRTLQELISFPAVGYGLVNVEMRVFQISSQAAFQRLTKNSKPDTVYNYVFEIR